MRKQTKPEWSMKQKCPAYFKAFGVKLFISTAKEEEMSVPSLGASSEFCWDGIVRSGLKGVTDNF